METKDRTLKIYEKSKWGEGVLFFANLHLEPQSLEIMKYEKEWDSMHKAGIKVTKISHCIIPFQSKYLLHH